MVIQKIGILNHPLCFNSFVSVIYLFVIFCAGKTNAALTFTYHCTSIARWGNQAIVLWFISFIRGRQYNQNPSTDQWAATCAHLPFFLSTISQFDRLDLSDPTVTFRSSIIPSLWERLSSQLRVTVKDACAYRISVWGVGEWWVTMSHLENHGGVASPGSWVDSWCLFISHLPRWLHQRSWRTSFYSEIISLL